MPTIIVTVTNDLSQDQRMQRICRSLQAAGYAVQLVGRELPHSLPLEDEPYRQQRLRCWFTKGKLFYLEYNLRLLIYLWSNKADIINAVDLDTLLPAYLIHRLRGISIVYDAHEYFTETPEVARRPHVQRIWSNLADWIIPRLQYVYTVGPALAQVMGKRYNTPFAVIRNVPLQRRSSKRSDSDKKIILYQGMLNEGRGLEVAIQAMTQLSKYELWLVGHGDIMQQLQDQTRRLDIEDRVRFLGFILPKDLPQVTAQAWLGLNLLENTGLSYYYSLANKAFDYIQAELPSVQMDFPEYRALQEEFAPFVLLSALGVDELVRSITALEEERVYRQLVTNCRNAAAVLHWEKEERLLLDFYENISSS